MVGKDLSEKMTFQLKGVLHLTEIKICAMTRRLRRKNQPRRDLVEEGLGGEHTVSVAWIGGRFSEIRTEKDPSV